MRKRASKRYSKIMTPPFTGSYPVLVEPRERDDGKDPEFSIVAIFDRGETLKAMKEAAREVFEDALGKDQSKWPRGLYKPWRTCDEKRDEDGNLPPEMPHADAFFMTFRGKRKPGVVGPDNVRLDDDEVYEQCYGGARYRAMVVPYWFDFKGKKGMAFGLRSLQKLKDGKPFGEGRDPTADFEAWTDPDAESATAEATEEDDLFS